jgi:hypothetical protein
MIKVNYDDTTGSILGYYPDEVGYESIPEPYIEIDKTSHLDCINNQGLRKVDLTTLKIIEYTPEVTTTTQTSETVDSTVLSIMEALAAQEERLTKLEGSVTA